MSGMSAPRRTLGIHAGSLGLIAMALASSHAISCSESIDIAVIPDDLYKEMEKMEAEDKVREARDANRVMVISCAAKFPDHIFIPEDAKEYKTPNQPFYAKFYKEPKGKSKHSDGRLRRRR